MWVVKLGGSLHGAPDALAAWLRALAEAPGPPRVVVPGGGPFADAVRRLQVGLGFDDLAAHRMAILAMQQAGLHLHALEPRLALAETDAELRAARGAVWLPWRLAGLEPSLAASWDVTSDSIACWLAARLGAGTLALVKSAGLPTGEASAAALARAGLVDPAFPAAVAAFEGRVLLLGRAPLPARLDEGRLAGACRVVA
jgi:aspartokinase-like uncharacterized kinase